MEELYEEGRIRAIGVSNFHPRHIDALMQTARIKPMVDQIRLCPGCTQPEIVDYCRREGIILEAYSPLGNGRIFNVPEVADLAAKYNKTVAQLCIRWSLDMGFIPLPKTVHPDRIKENLDVFDFKLEQDDIDYLSGLTGCAGDAPDPDTMPF